jgi:hypothetical protein
MFECINTYPILYIKFGYDLRCFRLICYIIENFHQPLLLSDMKRNLYVQPLFFIISPKMLAG